MCVRRPKPALFSQDRLRKVLRLIECPRIEALLDRCILDPPEANASSPPGSTTVAALMAFVEAGSRRGPQSAAAGGGGGSNQKPPHRLPSAVAASKLPAELVHGNLKHPNVTAGSLPLSPVTPRATSDTTSTAATGAANTVATAATTVATAAATAATGAATAVTAAATEATAETAAPPATATTPGIETTPATASTPVTTPSTDAATTPASTATEALTTTQSVDGDGDAYNDDDDDNPVGSESVHLLSPRVVPLISKRALRGSTAAETNAGVSGANRRERPENPGACQGSPLCSEQVLGEGTPPEEGRGGEPRDNTKQSGGSSSGGHSTTLVRHLGAALGLRGKEAYRRPGRGQPVWRKRETVIQERIVQYTTLDEQGTVSSPTFSHDRQQEVGRRY